MAMIPLLRRPCLESILRLDFRHTKLQTLNKGLVSYETAANHLPNLFNLKEMKHSGQGS